VAEIWGIAIAGVAGAAIGAYGASSAAGQQASASENAQQISENEFNTITQQEQPYIQSGYGAQSQLNYLLGIGTPGTPYSTGTAATPGYSSLNGLGALGGSGVPINIPGTPGTPSSPGTASSSPAGGYGSLLQPFTAQYMQQYSPAYQFQLQQGQQGVLNSDAAGQGALSGAALKDLTAYNQNYANTAYNNAFNQYQTQLGNTYSRLAGIAQLGQAAATNTGQQGTALAGQAAQSATNIGTAQAGGTVGAANALAGGLSSASLPWLYANSGSGTGGFTPDAGVTGTGGAYDTYNTLAGSTDYSIPPG
jgi:hypothetical protein